MSDYELSSGNVFADLGLDNAERRLELANALADYFLYTAFMRRYRNQRQAKRMKRMQRRLLR